MNEKELKEKRNELQVKMEEILNKAKVENRAMNDEEIKSFDDVEKEIKNIKAKIQKLEEEKEEYEQSIEGILELSANLEKEAVIIGVGTRLEIWNKSIWQSKDEEISAEEIAENMEGLGI